MNFSYKTRYPTENYALVQTWWQCISVFCCVFSVFIGNFLVLGGDSNIKAVVDAGNDSVKYLNEIILKSREKLQAAFKPFQTYIDKWEQYEKDNSDKDVTPSFHTIYNQFNKELNAYIDSITTKMHAINNKAKFTGLTSENSKKLADQLVSSADDLTNPDFYRFKNDNEENNYVIYSYVMSLISYNFIGKDFSEGAQNTRKIVDDFRENMLSRLNTILTKNLEKFNGLKKDLDTSLTPEKSDTEILIYAAKQMYEQSRYLLTTDESPMRLIRKGVIDYVNKSVDEDEHDGVDHKLDHPIDFVHTMLGKAELFINGISDDLDELVDAAIAFINSIEQKLANERYTELLKGLQKNIKKFVAPIKKTVDSHVRKLQLSIHIFITYNYDQQVYSHRQYGQKIIDDVTALAAQSINEVQSILKQISDGVDRLAQQVNGSVSDIPSKYITVDGVPDTVGKHVAYYSWAKLNHFILQNYHTNGPSVVQSAFKQLSDVASTIKTDQNQDVKIRDATESAIQTIQDFIDDIKKYSKTVLDVAAKFAEETDGKVVTEVGRTDRKINTALNLALASGDSAIEGGNDALLNLINDSDAEVDEATETIKNSEHDAHAAFKNGYDAATAAVTDMVNRVFKVDTDDFTT